MGYLLLTNDDGVDSPALLPFLAALSGIAEVRAVVPARERSWVSKAITRFDPVEVQRIRRDGFELHTVDGYPADCVQVGLAMFEEPPEMVVSGINLGLNHGLAFLLSSGTVGAAAEGWIAGVPGVAVSTGVLEGHRAWATSVWETSAPDRFRSEAALGADVVASIRVAGFPPGVDVITVNFVDGTPRDARRRVTGLVESGYDNLFVEREPGRFGHEFAGGLRIHGDLTGTDLEALQAGEVAINPVRLAHSAAVPDAFRAAVER